MIRDGRFEGILEPGRHSWFDPLNKFQIIVHDLSRPDMYSPWLDVIRKNHRDVFDRNFEYISTADNKVAVVRVDDHVYMIIPSGASRTFWKTMSQIRIEMVDISEAPEIDAGKLTVFKKVAPADMVQSRRILAHEVGLLFVDGKFRKSLKPGHYGYWSQGGAVEIQAWDMRERSTEVTAQEILTKDRVTLRLTLSAVWKVVDPAKTSMVVGELEERLYRQVQFAIRGAVAARTLDQLLDEREKLDAELAAVVRAGVREDDLGIQVETVQIRDVILPGDMREILNRVVEAEKQALANVIRRREETAATRSLLNTARLMDNNPLLLRLKELETLERLTEKIGRIDFHAGENGGFNSLLTKLLSLRPPEDEDEDEDDGDDAPD